MTFRDEPSNFTNVQEAARAIAAQFCADNIGDGRFAEAWTRENLHAIEMALILDGRLPNAYEVEALVGLVPMDGSDPEADDSEGKDYGVPEEVAVKFPNVNKFIESQF